MKEKNMTVTLQEEKYSDKLYLIPEKNNSIYYIPKEEILKKKAYSGQK